MATRTITSPGVEIREYDLSLRSPRIGGTNIYFTGFTNKGPSDEVIEVSNMQEWEQIYGTPTNAVERYSFHTAQQLFNSPGRVIFNRLPYGESTGEGFGSLYSALVYPVVYKDQSTGKVTTNLTGTSGTYVFGEPKQFNLTRSQYLSVVNGTGFTWSNTSLSGNNFYNSSFQGAISSSGLVIVNKAQTTINQTFEGYYIGLNDNTDVNPATNFDAIRYAYTVTSSAGETGIKTFTQIPKVRIGSPLSASNSSGNNPVNSSLSEVMENLSDYDISTEEFDDVLSIGVVKLRKSVFGDDINKLDFVLEEGYVGSIDSHRQIDSQYGGPPLSFALESVTNNSPNIHVMVNPAITKRIGESTLDSSGIPKNKIRVLNTLLDENITNGNISASRSGLTSTDLTNVKAAFTATGTNKYIDGIYPFGAYSSANLSNKVIGNLPSKIDRALEKVENDEIYELDLILEAGLGTVYNYVTATGNAYYDDVDTPSELLASIVGLQTSGDYSGSGATDARANYTTIFNKFNDFAQYRRKDLMFVADPLRHIFILGSDNKTLTDSSKNFSTHIYWALRHQFELANTSYSATYANWVKVNDSTLGRNVWVPFSGVAGAIMARVDAEYFPWYAPAGLNRAIVNSVVDLAHDANQRQRDKYYKVGLNPVSFFPSQGNVVWGQKTLSRKPSAFDRINVRRLFLALEKVTKRISKFFVFEPNTITTRTRVVNTLAPLFELAKNNEGLYEYMLVCDERNNTPTVIDDNELVIDVYIKPVRAAEFILVNFYASRSDQDFNELIG